MLLEWIWLKSARRKLCTLPLASISWTCCSALDFESDEFTFTYDPTSNLYFRSIAWKFRLISHWDFLWNVFGIMFPFPAYMVVKFRFTTSFMQPTFRIVVLSLELASLLAGSSSFSLSGWPSTFALWMALNIRLSAQLSTQLKFTHSPK